MITLLIFSLFIVVIGLIALVAYAICKEIDTNSDNYTANFNKMRNDIAALQDASIHFTRVNDTHRETITEYFNLYYELNKSVERIDENQKRDWSQIVEITHDLRKAESRIDDIAAVAKDNALIIDSISSIVENAATQVSPPRRKAAGRSKSRRNE